MSQRSIRIEDLLIELKIVWKSSSEAAILLPGVLGYWKIGRLRKWKEQADTRSTTDFRDGLSRTPPFSLAIQSSEEQRRGRYSVAVSRSPGLRCAISTAIGGSKGRRDRDVNQSDPGLIVDIESCGVMGHALLISTKPRSRRPWRRSARGSPVKVCRHSCEVAGRRLPEIHPRKERPDEQHDQHVVGNGGHKSGRLQHTLPGCGSGELMVAYVMLNPDARTVTRT